MDSTTSNRASKKGPPAVLTIAGSDPCGGSGIQADLRVFNHLGLYGLSAITAITAQNTEGVSGFFPVHPVGVREQLTGIAEDIYPLAVKTGMLATSGIVDEVADFIGNGKTGLLVIDPVLASTGGNSLSKSGVAEKIKTSLLPLCHIVTPNLHEAETLTGITIETPRDAEEAARILVHLGAGSACITGGHLKDGPEDIFYDGLAFANIKGEKLGNGADFHGTGCLFSAALTAYLALGNNTADSVGYAKRLVESAINGSISPGGGMRVPWLPGLS